MIELIDKNGAVNIKEVYKGDKGDKGENGFSPTIDYIKISSGHVLTVNDINGKKIITIKDGEKGSKGDKGDKGFSPVVSVSPGTSGNTLSITNENSPTETVFIPNGTSKVTLHSKYYANDSVNVIIDSGLGSYDVFLETVNPLPDKAVIYDVGIWYESNSLPLKEYRGIELYTTELISSIGFLEIISSATLDNLYYGGHAVARLVDENAGTLLTSIKMYDGCTKGFTVYYMVGDEVVKDE